MLIENYAGAMPPWLAPVQVALANISEHQLLYAESVVQALKKQGFRVHADLRNEKITYKIRALSLQKIPYILVVGGKEAEAHAADGVMRVAVRARGGVDVGVTPLDQFVQRLRDDVEQRRNFGGTA
jgi:threonyl-tRNA synthetase